MPRPDINSVIADFNALSPKDREMAADIIGRARIEDRRNAIAAAARKAELEFQDGKVRRGSVADLQKDLEGD